ncbi:MAG: hypothetical protein Q7J58_20135 [Hydrogenophaga sp.]|jgi:hypothetical protein|uniref:hypothetical protein n=1 Tax=Hydrogenophaga sp. TaxID=1904254 RepID=UPI00271A68EC|nr:hypothetical protein [Hydrogenophaga sp.]MDO9571666.1 hypothetical protein [Hydrogenophaga sp.]MDP3374568.1 hypothetical protein [Hydrogenophaga sp.]
MKPKKQFSEKALESLESRIPQMAQAAFSQAHLKALAVSGKVLQVSEGCLVELSAEGTVRVIKSVEPSFRVQAGVKRVRKVTRA